MMVLYLDRWARHSVQSHYYPISKDLQKSNIESKFLHFGSIFDNNFNTQESDKIIDISYFKRRKRNAYQIIELIKPNLVLFSGPLNQPIFQSFIHICQITKIPIGWIQYGNFRLKEGGDSTRIVKRINKLEAARNIHFSLKFLIRSYLSSKHTTSIMRLFFHYILAFLKYKNDYAWTKLDFVLKPDFVILFNNESSQRVRPLQIRREYICGNPFLNFESAEIEHRSNCKLLRALIIVQPFYETGIVKEFHWIVKNYIEIIELLLNFRFKVVVKLHPLSSPSFEKSIERDDIQILRKGNLEKLIIDSNVVIGVSSTVLLSAIFFKKKTILTQWMAPAHLKGIGFDNYSVFDISYNLDEFKRLLDNCRDYKMDEVERQRFIEEFIGPAYGAKSIKRIVNAIETEMISK